MAKREIQFKPDALQRVVSGVNKLAKTVGSTLGPGGRNVIFKKSIGWPLVTKDGVTVAKEVVLDDKFEDVGACLVRQIAEKTCSDAGDGTTTATILANAILTDGLQGVISGVNPIDIHRNLTRMSEEIVEYIRQEIKEDVSTEEQTKHIATVSANWDEEIGQLVSDAFKEVGVDGTIHVEAPKKSTHTTLRIIEGINFSRGYVTPYQVNTPKGTIEYNDPYILLYKGEFKSINDILEFLKMFKKATSDEPNASIVLVANEYGPDVIRMFAMNRNILNIAAIRAPYEKDMREETMNDLSMFFKCPYFDPNDLDDFGGKRKLDSIQLSELGRCGKVIITDNASTFIDGRASKEEISERIQLLKEKMDDPNIGEEVRRQTKVRISQLCARVAIVDIGAYTDTEEKEKRDRIDDALQATRAALEEGVVPGGCYAYLRALNNKDIFKEKYSTEAERIASSILTRALKAPFKKLLSNIGKDDESDMLIHVITTSDKENYGYNVKTQSLCNLKEEGIIDPFKVTRSALQNAVSIAGLILSSEAIIVEDSDE